MDELLDIVGDLDELFNVKKNIVDFIGDCPNIEHPVVSESFLWKKIASRGGYEVQENTLTGKYRIVSSYGTQVANGSKKVMIEKMKRLAAKDFFKKGDVIGVLRQGGLYEHYAIYIGNGKVIHYNFDNDNFDEHITVHETSYENFAKNDEKVFVVWFDEGVPVRIFKSTTFLINKINDFNFEDFELRKKKRKVYSPEETVRRARSRLGEEYYSLVGNNCEHFAFWCKTGVSESSQVRNITRAILASGVTGEG